MRVLLLSTPSGHRVIRKREYDVPRTNRRLSTLPNAVLNVRRGQLIAGL